MSKSTIRILTTLGIVVLLLASWYSMINKGTKLNKEYNTYIETARNKAELQIKKDALLNYQKALDMKESIELRDEIAQFYQDIGDNSGYIDWCLQIIEKYPYDKIGYERAVAYYAGKNDYYTCYETIQTAQRREIESENINKIKEESKYKYETTYVSYPNVGIYTASYFPVQKDNGLWGFMNAYGEVKISNVYTQYNVFTSAGVAPVYTQKGRWELIDTSGNTKSADVEQKNIEDVRPVYSDMMAVKYNGKYHYCDTTFKEKFGEYDDASAFSCGVAAVRKGGTWSIIDEKGNQVGSNTFDEIIMDDKTVAFRNDVAFAKKGNKYILIDTKGNQVGNSSWDEVDAFNSDQPAAVKIGEKWGFVNTKGETVVEPVYNGAHSFSNGFAAVMKLDRWGYIDIDDKNICIECQYSDAGDFSDGGSAFVKQEKEWTLIKIYSISKQK